ncbi:uncharacterized protein BO88DRAFT_465017 [Aspergillus vadensis CBS 113365]|uniref:Uncharacterized protein n=1 Tax=Aspergillus vadensis (strain CBS 113365 / IMI 142717 / IBT 24658) TaxID=1448311 RepID=A0A319BQM5_ASPVC|nr:hypothetical protein BO88DRAFT_465017 [Aspergillus vadensis CBS 113365]PYH68043.1 hypothetical protein BO88DRAFT_465017 [Aspergillus vadensis CBS 113365]
MVLVGSEKPSVHMRCAVATELLDELSAVPLAFFHASSTVTFLTKIESSRSSTPGLAVKLRGQISRTDRCMQQLSQQNSGPGLSSIGRTLLSNNADLSILRSPEQPVPTDIARGHQESFDSIGNIDTNLDLWSQNQVPAVASQPPSYLSPSRPERCSAPSTLHNTQSQETDIPFSNAFDFMQPDSSQAALNNGSMPTTNRYVLPSNLI